MKRFLRRQLANDRDLKLKARTDQRKYELNRNVTAMRGDDQRLRDRVATAISRIDTSIVPHPASRATLPPTRVISSLPPKRSDISS
jgi:hypothetical protein